MWSSKLCEGLFVFRAKAVPSLLSCFKTLQSIDPVPKI